MATKKIIPATPSNYFAKAIMPEIKPDRRTSEPLKHLRRAYGIAGIDVPADVAEVGREVLTGRYDVMRGEAFGDLRAAAESLDADERLMLIERAADTLASAEAWRGIAFEATGVFMKLVNDTMPGIRARAAADLTPAFKKTVARLGELAGRFDPVATTSLDPLYLTTQRQYDALPILADVRAALSDLGALTVTPGNAVLSPVDLVVDVEWPEDDAAAAAIAGGSYPWIRDGEWSDDIYLLAMAGGWATDAKPSWRLLAG